MQYLAENMLGRTFCPLGDAAAMPMIGFFKKFREEFEEYIKAHPAAPETQTLVELVGA
jgi:NADH-quinone oxidoreductase subunit F